MKNTVISHSPQDTELEARRMAEGFAGTETVALFGDLGMGKTAFVRGLAKGLGIDDGVSSPTFAIMHEHDNAQGKCVLCHYDMYRVENWDDLETTGFLDTVGRCVNAVEWSENIENALPVPRWNVTISRGDTDDERIINEEYIEY